MQPLMAFQRLSDSNTDVTVFAFRKSPKIRKDHLQGIEEPDMPLALSLRGRLWAAAAVCRRVGGTFIE